MTQNQNDELATAKRAEANELREKLVGDGNLGDIIMERDIRQLEEDASMLEDCAAFSREHEQERLREAGIVK